MANCQMDRRIMKLQEKAEEIVGILKGLPQVKKCKIYGSLTNETYDELSDIDIEIDVSGEDNGKFMLRLVDLLKEKLDIIYSDYAPSLIPQYYIVSVAIDKTNPFLIVDFRCSANPHCITVTKKLVKSLNDNYSHILKLWTANLKHFARKKDCYSDIVNMANKLDIDVVEKTEKELLYQTLLWLENNAKDKFKDFVETCKRYFYQLI